MLLQSTGASRRFSVTGLFAEGAQSKLYTARDEITGEICLLKTGEGVKQEALLSLELNHPYIAHAYDFGTHPEIGVYAAYPKFSDPSLRTWCSAKSLVRPDFRRVVLQITEFLAFLHHRGWLYHDFKPDHFLVGEDSIKVLDLGLCTKINESHTSNTFSGTFPYISPERLTGRKFDLRSDIFGLGMMLLHLFCPEEDWSGEPSLALLQQLQKRSHDLPQGFWKKLIVQMTSLEPSQRSETAAELWKKLLPQKARGTFLIFPVPAMFSLASEVLEAKKRIVVAKSSSQINLDLLENQVLAGAWSSNTPTIVFDLQRTSVEKAFCKLASLYSTTKPKNLFTAIDSLQKIESPEIVVVLQGTTANPKSFLSYALCALSGGHGLRLLIPISKDISLFKDLEYKRIETPPLSKPDIQELLYAALPAKEIPTGELISKATFFKIEQLITELRMQLPKNGFKCWPAVTKKVVRQPAMKKLTKLEMTILGCIALAQGSLKKEILIKMVSAKPQLSRLLKGLLARGYVELHEGRYLINLPIKHVLKLLGKNRQKLAKALLNDWSINEEPEVLYNLSRIARRRRLGAYIGLKQARYCSANKVRDRSYDWLYKAFECGAKLPKTTLRQLVVRYMRAARMKKAERLLKYMHQRFKLSYQLADMFLDYDFRHKNLRRAQRRAERIVAIAKKKHHANSHDYFSTRLARFLILDKSFRSGEIILKKLLHKSNLRKRTLLLVHYCMGLSLLLRGDVPKAIHEFRKAVGGAHHCRSYAYMNLGISFAQIGKFRQGMIFCSNSLAIFSKLRDLDKLSHGLNNLGCVYQNAGDFVEAHEYYLRSAHLCRATGNKDMYVSALNNLADVYRVEGRTDLALSFNLRAVRLSKLFSLPASAAAGLHNGGLQYAIQGKFRRAIVCIKRALTIRKSLGLKRDIACSQEYLGITYLLADRYSEALKYLNDAAQTFRASGCLLDCERAKLYGFLAQNQRHKSRISTPISRQSFTGAKGSFEVGLYNYVLAYTALNSSKLNRRSCRKDLVKAEYIFRKIPDLFWLARLFKLKSDYLHRTEHHEKARLSLEAAYNIFSRLGAQKELSELAKYELSRKIDFSRELGKKPSYKLLIIICDIINEPTAAAMIEKILSKSKEFTGTERAALVLFDKGSTKARVYTNDNSFTQTSTRICELAKKKFRESKRVLVTLGSGSEQSKHFTCLALRTCRKLLGIVCLESSKEFQLPASKELENFSVIVGTALDKVLRLETVREENKTHKSQIRGTYIQRIESTLRSIEKNAIEKRLRESNWNFRITAQSLGLTVKALHSKVKYHKIQGLSS